MSWSRYLDGTPIDQVPPYLERLLPVSTKPEAAADSAEIAGSLQAAGGDEKKAIIGRYVHERVARVLGYKDHTQVDVDLTLLELGFDSLMAIQLRNAIRSQLGADVPIGKLFDSTSVEALTEMVHDRLAAPAAGGEQVEIL
jgi:microcystin synthetase protein McyG